MSTFDKSNTTEGAAQQFLVESNQCPLHQNVTIETISEDVLLAIFTSYLRRSEEIDTWRTLVHVCQRWRYLVFSSPRHLNLRLECTTETPAKEMLGVWPAFPIVITDKSDSMGGADNIIAALEQRDRVCEITLEVLPGRKMDMYVRAMLGPFPALESIILEDDNGTMTVVPDSFLGGSAPQLQQFALRSIPFPALPTLLSSARNLVGLEVTDISRSDYISPEVMVTCLSVMPGLEYLLLIFDSPESFPKRESRRHRPLARSTLPALRELLFWGVEEYFEDLVALIDTPMVRDLQITFYHRPFFEFSQLSQFIGRAGVFKSPAVAKICLHDDETASVQTRTCGPARLLLGISCDELHLQLRYFAQVCGSSLLPFSGVESLAISSQYQIRKSPWGSTEGDILRWLDILHPFSAVKVLNIDENSLTTVAFTLKNAVNERIPEIFPAIREISIGEHLPSSIILGAIEKFATARGLFTRLDRPHRWVAS